MKQNKSFLDKFPRLLRATIRGYKGRVCRRDYWLLFPGCVGVLFIVGLIGNIIEDNQIMSGAVIGIIILLLVCHIVFALLGWSIMIGRIHDLGHSGWWLLIYIVAVNILIFIGVRHGVDGGIIGTIVGLCFSVYLGFAPSQKKANKWGDNPH